MKVALIICIAVAVVATNISAKEATSAERRVFLNQLLKERRALAQEFWNRWGKLERGFWSRWVLTEENYLQKLFGSVSNSTTTRRPLVANDRRPNPVLARRNKVANNMGAIKKRADAKRIQAIKKALASRKNGTVSVLPVRRNNATVLRQRFLSSKNITLTKLPNRGNSTIRFAHLPVANGTHSHGNATMPLVKLTPLRAVNGTVKGVKGAPAVLKGAPAVLKGAPAVVKAPVRQVRNMTEAQLAARRKAVLAKFAKGAQKPAVNGTAKAVKRK